MSEKKFEHKLLKKHYVARAVGMIFFGLVVGAAYYDLQQSLFYWTVLAVNVFIWPHIGYWMAKRTANPMRSERVLMYIDAFLAGCYLATMNFSLLPSVAALGGNLVSNVMTGGLRLELRGLVLTALGAIGVSALHGFEVQLSAGLVPTATSVVFIFAYLIITSKQANSTLNDLRESSRKLAAKNAEVNRLLKETETAKMEAEKARFESDRLLHNILPIEIARELKTRGATEPVYFEKVSVMFTDFEGFTQVAEQLTPHELVRDLDACFGYFDKVTEKHNLEKLKTIGDSYMCAGGIPKVNRSHAINCVLAALEIQAFMNLMKQIKTDQGLPYWELRLGIHSGPLVAGVIGERRFAYDVWGDTVNTASRMESSGTPGKINISLATYEMVKDYFECEHRGVIEAKNKGAISMYYVNGLREEYAADPEKRVPSVDFLKEIESFAGLK